MLWNELKKKVIDPGFCIHCGACAAFCNRIDVLNSAPALVKECVPSCVSPYGAHGVCYEHCPMVQVLESKHIFMKAAGEDILGEYRAIKAARSKKKEILKNAQDGGVVTSILSAAFKAKKIDAAIVVGRDENWKPQPQLITSAEQLLASGGSKYTESNAAFLLGKASRNKDIKNLAFVGIPCQIQAVRNLEYGLMYPDGFSPYSDLKIYAIGLFCAGTFNYDKLFSKLSIDPTEVKKMDAKKSEFTIYGENIKRLKLKDVEDTMLYGCNFCLDYTSKLGDISVGSIGTKEGWSTVIERTLRGFALLKDAENEGFAEVTSEVDVKELKRIVEKRSQKIERNIEMRRNKKLLLPPIFN